MSKTELLDGDEAGVARATELLKQGELVAFPTETVYGLGADASSTAAVEKIYAAKGRPTGHPLIVHAADAAAALSLSNQTSRVAETLARKFWPGPLTLILSRGNRVVDAAVGGRSTVGLRVPANPLAAKLCADFESGIAAPSANRFGGVSPTTAGHVLDDLDGQIAAVLDGGRCEVGLESTIVELTEETVTILRPGAVTRHMLQQQLATTGATVIDGTAGTARAPGMLKTHYAPQKPLKIVSTSKLADMLGQAGVRYAVIAPFQSTVKPSWELPGDAAGFGQQLYAALRQADRHPADVDQILVVPPATSERFEVVMDRLQKAAFIVESTGS